MLLSRMRLFPKLQFGNVFFQRTTFSIKKIQMDLEEKKDINKLLYDASYSHNVLDVFTKLTKLNQKGDLCFATEVEACSNFPGFCEAIHKQTIKCSPKSIYYALSNLLKLGVDSSHPLFETIENDMIWILSKTSIRILVKTFLLMINRQKTIFDERLINCIKMEVEDRIHEINFAWDIAVLFEHSSHFTSNFLRDLSSRTIEIGINFKSHERMQILHAIGKSGTRPREMIGTLALPLVKKKTPFSSEEICNCFFALGKLDVIEIPLLNRLCSDLCQCDSITDEFEISSILSSMGHLRLRKSSVLDFLILWIDKNLETCSSATLINMFQTLGILSYKPTIDNFLNRVCQRLDMKSLKDAELIHFVWSLVLLGEAKEKHISYVLKRFPNIESFPSDIGLRIKLLNINAAAKLLLNYSGKVIEVSHPDKLIDPPLSEFKSFVLLLLNKLFPEPKYSKTNLMTSMGFAIFCFGILRNDGSATPLSKYFDLDFNLIKNLPPDLNKVAIIPCDFKQYNLGTSIKTGDIDLAIKLLKKEGYKVLEIPFFEVNMNLKAGTLERIQRMLKNTLNVSESQQ